MNKLPLHSYDWDRETWDEQRDAGRYTAAQVIIWRGNRHAIGAGTADDVDLFTEGGALYILSRHRGLGYAGLQVFRGGEEIANSFVDGEEQGDYINGLTAVYAAKRLANWADCENGHALGFDY